MHRPKFVVNHYHFASCAITPVAKHEPARIESSPTLAQCKNAGDSFTCGVELCYPQRCPSLLQRIDTDDGAIDSHICATFSFALD